MAIKDITPRLRLIQGGKVTKADGKKHMTEIGLLDEKEYATWQLVRQAARRPPADLVDDLQREESRVRELLTKRLEQLKEIHPDLMVDLSFPAGMAEEVRNILFAPPLSLTPDGRIMLID